MDNQVLEHEYYKEEYKTKLREDLDKKEFEEL